MVKSPAAIFFLAVSMSVDAFAIAVGRGATVRRPGLLEALRAGLVFGTVETLTPLAGWSAGMLAGDWVAHFDHWLAFLLLSAVGAHLIHDACKADEKKARKKGRFLVLVATAIGSSFDAMAVGLSLAFLGVKWAPMLLISLSIGFATFVLATAGLMVGNVFGHRMGKWAEIAAGMFLIGLGGKILYEHLLAI